MSYIEEPSYKQLLWLLLLSMSGFHSACTDIIPDKLTMLIYCWIKVEHDLNLMQQWNITFDLSKKNST